MYLIFDKDTSFKKALSFVVVLLVASIPIAIEIVCTCTLALGSRQLAAMNAIVTRLVSIEEMAGMNMLCSDKTGTLTLNKMVIQDECPTYTPGINRDDVVLAAALAAKWKEPAKDALDTMVLGSANIELCDTYQQVDYMPFDPSVKRTEGTLIGPDGVRFKTTKGAPQIIMGLCHNKNEIAKDVEATVTSFGLRGIRCLAVARTLPGSEDQWEMLGILTFLDPPRPDTKRTIERAMEYGVSVKMITGDQVVIACETSRTLGLGTNIKGAQGLPDMDPTGKVPKDLGTKYGKMIAAADGFAQVYPEHKYLIVETLRQEGFTVGMTGDGVNDAPALKRADVGIAVSGATDAARAAADIVLTSPGLSVVVEAIIIARCIFQRVLSFINYRVAATLQLLVFFFIAVFAFPPTSYDPGTEAEAWPKFFQLPVLMLMLITLLNDGTLITIGYDYVIPSSRPEKWNLRVLFLTSSILAAVACGSSLLLLWCALDSYNPSGVFQAFGLPHIEYDQIATLIYLKVSLSDFLTLFSARTQGPFYSQRPGVLLFCGACFALTISTILACVWPTTTLDDLPVKGLARGDYGLWAIWVWIYCLVWWLIQDAAKVLAYKLIYKYNIFNAQAGRKVLTRDMTHYGEGHEMDDLKRDDIVQLSYNAKTGKEVGADLKKHLAGEASGAPEGSLHGHMGKELEAKMTEDENGEIYMTVSYSKQSGKDVARQLKEQLRNKQ
jgi:H+-transporting ATPase